MTTVVSIGTTHPWNIAGIGLDLLVGQELGVRVVTVCAAVSAQDAGGLRALETLPAEIVRAQLAAVEGAAVDAVRVGALTSPEIIRLVGDALRRLHDRPAVVDPVMSASLGGSFGGPAAVDALRHEIASLPNVILTPNIAEARAFLADRPIGRESLREAADELLDFGARAVLLKGGHLDGSPVDALATNDGVELFEGSRIEGELRGTGCLLAMSLACALAQGRPLRDAVDFARGFVRQKIAAPREFGGLRVAY
ncbi:MAG: hydroxymethylpyrimidine/phosphomethylpyrimidine kinase [Candidatus Eremiobacteraeota bacterium]|nr:hydroxymethylpyrimidine/phosphomethylpyrimidine kinase [Candidatus Eremiobacteraeota bacterium]